MINMIALSTISMMVMEAVSDAKAKPRAVLQAMLARMSGISVSA
jgi:hypothetical protein